MVYDRMALYDSLVAATAVWALFFEVMLIKYLRFDLALILGMVIGAGLLTKSSAFFYIYLLPFSLIIINLSGKDTARRVIKWLGLALVSAGFSYVIYSILRLSPFYHIINEKNATFVYPFKEWLVHPFAFLVGNLRGLLDWLTIYMTVPVIIMVLISFLIEAKKFFKEKILLFIWFAAPFFALAIFGKTLYPRFIFFMTIPLIAMAAYSIYYIFKKAKKISIGVLFFVLITAVMLRSDYLILTNFSYAPIPYVDLEQYINSWPAGGGVKEIVSYLNKQSKNNNIFVASEGTFGSIATYSIEIYLGSNKNIEAKGYWPVPYDIPKEILLKAQEKPAYMIFNQSQKPPMGYWPISFIAKYQKGHGDSYISLYKVIPK